MSAPTALLAALLLCSVDISRICCDILSHCAAALNNLSRWTLTRRLLAISLAMLLPPRVWEGVNSPPRSVQTATCPRGWEPEGPGWKWWNACGGSARPAHLSKRGFSKLPPQPDCCWLLPHSPAPLFIADFHPRRAGQPHVPRRRLPLALLPLVLALLRRAPATLPPRPPRRPRPHEAVPAVGD